MFTIDPSAPIGGKARALARLAGLDPDLPIPPWTALPPQAEFTPDRLAAALAPLGPGPIAVRSSAEGEDGARHSHAGQFESVLNVAPAEVPVAIARVRASARAEHLLTYRASRGLTGPAPEPAVLLQAMVPASVAGVAFSADPVTGRRDHCVIAAVEGLGESLVSGAADGQRWVVDDRNRTVAEDSSEDSAPSSASPQARPPLLAPAQLAQIATLARRCAALSGCPQDIEWALDTQGDLWLLQSRPITTLGQLPDPAGPLRIWDNSNLVESYAGVTTPLTFSFARRAYEHVYRRLIALLGVPRRQIREAELVLQQMIGLLHGRMYYQLSNWYHLLALLPGYRLNSRFMEQMMGVTEPIPREIADAIARRTRRGPVTDALALLRTLMGIAWQAARIESRCRAFQIRFDQALADTAEGLDTLDIAQLSQRYRLLEGRLLTRWDAPLVNDFLCMIAAGVVRAQCKKAGDESQAAALLANCGEVISAEPPRRLAELAAAIRAIPGLVERLEESLDRSREEAGKGLAACGPRPAEGSAGVAEVLRLLRAHPRPRHLWDAYLSRFGDRCLGELKLESPTVASDPGPTLAALAALAKRSDDPACGLRPAPCGPSPAPASPPDRGDPAPPGQGSEGFALSSNPSAGWGGPDSSASLPGSTGVPPVTHSTRRQNAVAPQPRLPRPHRQIPPKITDLNRSPELSLPFLRRWWLTRARNLLRRRENLRFERTRLFGRVRAIFLQMGQRLAAEGQLGQPQDIFYLELEEILGLSEGHHSAPEALGALARARREQFEAYAAGPEPPGRVSTRGPLHREPLRADSAAPSSPAADAVGSATPGAAPVLQGLGASPGAVRGRARVVLDPRRAHIEPGEILVAPQTDPGWIVLFAPAAGLVVERGSLLSHAAIVSRELRLPCAVSVPQATTRIQTGDELEIDGSSGTVTILSPAEA